MINVLVKSDHSNIEKLINEKFSENGYVIDDNNMVEIDAYVQSHAKKIIDKIIKSIVSENGWISGNSTESYPPYFEPVSQSYIIFGWDIDPYRGHHINFIFSHSS